MATFVRVGRHWLNLELVTSIEFVENAKTADLQSVRIHYSTGKHHDFKDEDDIRDLRAFLETHQAK